MRMQSLALSLAAAGLAVPAAAADEVPRIAVRYGDLNLTTAEGQSELQQRLNKAAWKVCMFDERGLLRTGDGHAACYRTARKEVAVQFARVVGGRHLGG